MKIVTTNSKAFQKYEILETFEAGIELKGSEVKSLRESKASLSESFITIEKAEAFVNNMHISPYTHSSIWKLDPKRKRKLLLHKKEILKIFGTIQKKNLYAIPLEVYFNNKNYVKVKIGLAKPKKIFDRREELKKRDLARESKRDFKFKITF